MEAKGQLYPSFDPNAELSDDQRIAELRSSQARQLASSQPPKNVSLRVTEPTIKEETFKKHINYKVSGFDEHGEIDCIRRYSAFNTLRAVLVERWPGCFIPPLPGKKIVGNFEPSFIEERRGNLELFLNQIIRIPHVYNGDEMQTFLRTKAIDIVGALNNLPKLSYDDIIEKYTKVYTNLSGIELNNDSVLTIANFQSYLQKVSKMFENFKSMSSSMVSAKKAYYDQLANVHQMLIVDYEKNCLTQYADNNEATFVFTSPESTQLFVKMSKIRETSLHDSYESLHAHIRQEHREIKAFLETIGQRDKYQQIKEKLSEKVKTNNKEVQQLSAGKSTVKSIFTFGKSKDQQLSEYEKSNSETTNSIGKVQMLHDMMTLIIAHCEIAKFKDEKVDKYIKVMKQLSGVEERLSEEVHDFWATVKRNPILQ